MNPSEQIDQLLASIADWRGETFAILRETLLGADKEIVEEWKWKGSPAWYRYGLIAVANAHKGKVKITFSHGANIPDPDKLFNAGLDGKVWRAIDFLEGDKIHKPAFKRLIRAAVAYNQSKAEKKPPAKKAGTAVKQAASKTRAKVQASKRA